MPLCSGEKKKTLILYKTGKVLIFIIVFTKMSIQKKKKKKKKKATKTAEKTRIMS